MVNQPVAGARVRADLGGQIITVKHSVSRPDLENMGRISAESFGLATCVRARGPRFCLAGLFGWLAVGGSRR
jgi:hypothetical protein